MTLSQTKILMFQLELQDSHSQTQTLRIEKLIWRPIPCTPENLAFADYVKSNFPHFCMDDFLQKRG